MELPGDWSDKDRIKANFLIPADQDLLKAVIKNLRAGCHYGGFYKPGNEEKLLKLRAEVAAAKAYRQVFEDAEEAEGKQNKPRRHRLRGRA